MTIGRNSAISRGTHYRILSQARTRIKRSLMTTALAVQLGVVSADDVQKLIAVTSKVPSDVDADTMAEVTAITRALIDRIVTL